MYSTRPQRKTLTKLCPYCGKTRTYTYRDGYDEVDYGTAAGTYRQKPKMMAVIACLVS